MASNRIGRINEEIQRELSSLIPTVKDPRVTGMISVTSVNTTPDLKFAKIYVSVLDKRQETQVLKGLKSAGGYLRRELGRTLTCATPRSCPLSPTTPSTTEPASCPCSGTRRWSSRSTRTTTTARTRRRTRNELHH